MSPQHLSSRHTPTYVRYSWTQAVELRTYTGHEGNIDAIAKVIEASPEFARQLDYSARPGTKTYPRCGSDSRLLMTNPPTYRSSPSVRSLSTHLGLHPQVEGHTAGVLQGGAVPPPAQHAREDQREERLQAGDAPGARRADPAEIAERADGASKSHRPCLRGHAHPSSSHANVACTGLLSTFIVRLLQAGIGAPTVMLACRPERFHHLDRRMTDYCIWVILF